jgi:hypothetical protein
MGDPVTTTLMMQVGSTVLGGVQAYGQAAGEKKRAEINSHIGRTRAIQTDATARDNLSDELASIRNSLANGGQTPGVGTFEILQDFRKTRDRDRRVEFGNRMSEAADWRQQAANIRPGAKLASGLIDSGPQLFSIAQLLRPGGR